MLIISVVLIAALVAEDQLIKLFIVNNIAESSGAVNFYTFKLGEFKIFSITHIRNKGAGWSILEGKTVFLTVITVAVMALIVGYMIYRRKTIGKLELLSLCFIIGGGVGNLIDRLRMLIEGTDSFSGVIDYIKLEFISYPIFNFADCCVVIGAILFCVFVLFSEVKTSKMKKITKSEASENESV